MEELLSEKNYICKAMSGLKNNCKLLIGFNPLTCKLFLGRGTDVLALGAVAYFGAENCQPSTKVDAR